MLSLLLMAAISGDALSDLRATLTQLAATSPAHGTFEVESTSSNSEEQQAFQGKAAVGFAIDDAGLRVLYPKATLTQANQEARAEASDPERQTPVRSGVDRIHALHLGDLLNASSMLTIQLLNAQLIEAKPAAYRGKPARLVVLKVTPRLSKSESKHVKKIDSTLSVWLGDDGLPLAAERKLYLKASFMLLSFEQNRTEKWDYARSGDRLVAVRYEENEKSDGFGQHNVTHAVEVVRLEP